MGKKMQGWGEKKIKRKKKEKNPEKSFKKYNFFLQNDDPAMKNVGRG